MNYGIKQNITGRIRAGIKKLALAATLFGASVGLAQAAYVSGSFGVGGAYSLAGDELTFNSVTSGIGDVDFSTTINFSTLDGTIINGVIDLASFTTPVTDVFEIGGWTLDIDSLVVGQSGAVVELDGTGIISGYGYTPTPVNWGFSAQTASSYSMTITAVPVPAAVWLFGSGLIGMVAVARRKTA